MLHFQVCIYLASRGVWFLKRKGKRKKVTGNIGVGGGGWRLLGG